jgi:UDP-N-acetylmuramate dehydrogenase
MMSTVADILIERAAAIPTWFRIGGGADRLARPETVEQLRRAVEIDPSLRVLGDGANLLVDDDGVGELVVVLDRGEFVRVEADPGTGRVVAGAGADLPKLIVETVRQGLGGLEVLGGIPATVGGAAIMNAGGAFGQFADCVRCVHGLDRAGREVTRERRETGFSYRSSGLQDLVLTRVEFALTPGDPAALRLRLKEVMEYKKRTQPLAANSAGCVFKNPALERDLEGIDVRPGQPELRKGDRISAGFLIDRAGCKAMTVGGATVSDRHANFIVTQRGATAGHVIELIGKVRDRVRDRLGVALETEVVIWRRSS